MRTVSNYSEYTRSDKPSVNGCLNFPNNSLNNISFESRQSY